MVAEADIFGIIRLAFVRRIVMLRLRDVDPITIGIMVLVFVNLLNIHHLVLLQLTVVVLDIIGTMQLVGADI
jgi:hypothetical protein